MSSEAFKSQIVRPRVEEPHFVDEETIVSARRVVPLRKLQRQRTGWSGGFIVGAFVLALAMGAATALLIVHLPGRREVVTVRAESQVLPNKSEPVETIDTLTSEQSLAENNAEDGLTPAMADIKAEDPPKPVLAHKKATIVVTPKAQVGGNNTDTAQPVVVPEHTSEPAREQPRATLYDQWQERRQRRVERRERRLKEIYGAQDLFRIDEIFQGKSRRPVDRP